MKKLTIFLTLIFLLIMSRPGICVGKKVATSVINLDHTRFLSASFIGNECAWLVTRYGGNLIVTFNGGKQWNTVSANAVNGFRQISFISKMEGWATGPEGWVWKTTNGGLNWKSIAKIEPHNKIGFMATQAKFIDELHGWVLETPHYLWRTEDGGRSWQVYSPSTENHSVDFAGFTFIDSKTGWLACDRGTVLKTTDGGKNWKALRILGPSPNFVVLDIHFLNDKVGWALVGGNVYCTHDGGESWQLQSPLKSRSAISSLFFLDENNGWAAGRSNILIENITSAADVKGKILRSNDAGKTWNSVDVNVNESGFFHIYFPDNIHGWLVSDDKIYRTNDGGNSWNTVLKIR